MTNLTKSMTRWGTPKYAWIKSLSGEIKRRLYEDRGGAYYVYINGQYVSVGLLRATGYTVTIDW